MKTFILLLVLPCCLFANSQELNRLDDLKKEIRLRMKNTLIMENDYSENLLEFSYLVGKNEGYFEILQLIEREDNG